MPKEPDQAAVSVALKTAARRSSTNWPVMATIVCFSGIMCVMASNLKDGSEAWTILLSTVSSFFVLVVGYLFTGHRSGS